MIFGFSNPELSEEAFFSKKNKTQKNKQVVSHPQRPTVSSPLATLRFQRPARDSPGYSAVTPPPCQSGLAWKLWREKQTRRKTLKQPFQCFFSSVFDEQNITKTILLAC